MEGVPGQSTWRLFVSIETISQSSGPHESLLKGLDGRRGDRWMKVWKQRKAFHRQGEVFLPLSEALSYCPLASFLSPSLFQMPVFTSSRKNYQHQSPRTCQAVLCSVPHCKLLQGRPEPALLAQSKLFLSKLTLCLDPLGTRPWSPWQGCRGGTALALRRGVLGH